MKHPVPPALPKYGVATAPKTAWVFGGAGSKISGQGGVRHLSLDKSSSVFLRTHVTIFLSLSIRSGWLQWLGLLLLITVIPHGTGNAKSAVVSSGLNLTQISWESGSSLQCTSTRGSLRLYNYCSLISHKIFARVATNRTYTCYFCVCFHL